MRFPLQVRQLSELGFKIPQPVQTAVVPAERFYRYGLKLKQVANFYNTMTEQIWPSQSTMLYKESQQFEQIVKESKVSQLRGWFALSRSRPV